MWPGQQQPPGGEQNPQQPNNPYQQPGYQQPNPYQQPGFQQPGVPQPGVPQPNPYAQQPQWGAPGPVGAPEQPPGGGGGNRTKVVAIVAALAVIVAAGVTGFLVLGGDKDDEADGGKDAKPSATASTDPSTSASASASEGNPRGGEGEKATVAGWKIVVNPKWGTAFDVPADWEVQSPTSAVAFEEENSDEIKPIITMSAPAILKSNWCESDDDKDGRTDTMSLAATGTKGANGAKDTDEVALNTPAWWVYGGYTQPDKKTITADKKATPYTTASGVKGSYSWASSTDTPAKGKCVTDGKAITFGFKNSAGDFVSWNFYGAKGVKDEVPEATVMKILSTVRLHGEPTG